LDVGLISWDNYFIAQFLSLGDQRNRRKERKILSICLRITGTTVKGDEYGIDLRDIDVDCHFF